MIQKLEKIKYRLQRNIEQSRYLLEITCTLSTGVYCCVPGNHADLFA